MVYEVALALLLLSSVAILPAYAYNGSHTDSVTADVPVNSRYAQLDVCDGSGNPLDDPMFTDSSISYANGVLSESVLIDGARTLKINNFFGTPSARPDLEKFLVRYDSQHPSNDGVIPLKIVISTDPIDLESLDSSYFTNLSTPVDQSYRGDDVYPYVVSATEGSSYYVYIKTGSTDVANPITLTGDHNITLTFSAVFADGTACASSNNNTIKLGVSDFIAPDAEEEHGRVFPDTFENPEDSTDVFPAAQISYDGGENAVGVGTESNYIIDNEIPFCIYYKLQGNKNVTMTITVSGVGFVTVAPPPGNDTIEGFIGMDFSTGPDNTGLRTYSSLNSLKVEGEDGAWIYAGSESGESNFSLTISGNSKGKTALATVIFNPPLT